MTTMTTEQFMILYAEALAAELTAEGFNPEAIRAATDRAAQRATEATAEDRLVEPQPPADLGEVDLKNGFATLTVQLVHHFEREGDPNARSRTADFLLALVSVLIEHEPPGADT